MQNHYIRFGRRYRLPSTVEIHDELRADFVPGYVHKSWAQYGFAKPGSSPIEPEKQNGELLDLALKPRKEPIETRS
jgi:hypothetical protein